MFDSYWIKLLNQQMLRLGENWYLLDVRLTVTAWESWICECVGGSCDGWDGGGGEFSFVLSLSSDCGTQLSRFYKTKRKYQSSKESDYNYAILISNKLKISTYNL